MKSWDQCDQQLVFENECQSRNSPGNRVKVDEERNSKSSSLMGMHERCVKSCRSVGARNTSCCETIVFSLKSVEVELVQGPKGCLNCARSHDAMQISV